MPRAKTLRLYNSLTRRVDPVEPSAHAPDGTPHLRFYACGPTVYTYAHIGNFRSFLTADLILRAAHALGWQTTYVSNVTDVGHLTGDDLADAGGEDKMARALEQEGRRFANIYDLARFYTDALVEDWRALNLRSPDVRPRATEHITEQIEAAQRLVERGHAYETDRGIYFSVASFPAYGQLSGRGQDADALESARDVVQDSEKRDPRDFALWKKDSDHLMQWYSPFTQGATGGRGFPGWHLECSVMSMKYLGETFDLHAGGEDLIFPHHECEIAQNESLTGQRSVRYWVHTRFLQVEGRKMSKSKGNFFTVRDLIAPEPEGRGIDPLALRLALLSGQYRKPFDFTFDELRTSARHVQRFQDALRRADAAIEESASGEDAPGEDALAGPLGTCYDRVLEAMLDDLNTPAAKAGALDGVSRILAADLGGASARSARRWLGQINDLLGVVYSEYDEGARADAGADDPLAAQVEALLDERAAARAEKNYARADAIRDELDALGVEVMDSAEGTTWRKKVQV